MKKIFLYPAMAVLLLLGVGVLILWRGTNTVIWLALIIALSLALFVWAIPVILKRVNPAAWIVTGFIILFGLLFPTSSLMSRDYAFGPFSTLTSTTIFLLPSLALVNAAFLLYSVEGLIPRRSAA